jgi:hypothetical protein
VLAFLGIAGFRVGEGYDGTVVLHDDGREFQRYSQFLAEGDEEV